MSCKICGRSSCTQSFHSLDEQALFEQREAMPDDVPLLRRMVQEAACELLQIKADILILENNCSVAGEAEALAQAKARKLKQALFNAAEALDKMGNSFSAQSAYDAANSQ